MKFHFILFLFYNIAEAGEHVVFERIGMMSGATSFIHVHVTLGIELLRKQVDSFRDLLENDFSNTDSIFKLFNKQGGTEVKSPDLQNHLKAMSVIWHRIADQHRLDVLDIHVTLDSLKNTMPDIPNKSVRKIGRGTSR
jgi:hypothetical protein